MDSMYGGHAGASFVLSGFFESVDAMVAAFSQGAAYTDIWYNQYAIIDTPNKNDADNGKIYRRGLNYTNSMGGAEYLGQIVGPSSGTPYFQMNGIAETKAQGTVALEDNSYRKVPVSRNEDGTYNIADKGTPGTFEYKAEAKDIIPGKYIDEEDGSVKYNDAIQYTWVNIRKDDADADSWFYIGWAFPYTVIDYEVHQVSQYDENGLITENTDNTTAERVDDYSHPYYEKWDIGIPKGIKGDTLRNIRVIVPTSNDVIYDPKKITTDAATGAPIFPDPGYDGLEDDIGKRQIIVADYLVFDEDISPAPKMIYLGDFNIVKNISVADNGTLTINYTHNDDSVFDKKVRWISRVTLYTSNGEDSETGTVVKAGDLLIVFNDGSIYKPHLIWPNGIDIAEDGTVTVHYIGQDDVVYDKYLKWVKEMTLTTGNGSGGGRFTTTYNNESDPYVANMQWLKDFQLSKDGTLTWTYAGTGKTSKNKTIPDSGIITENKAFRWPVSAELKTDNGAKGGKFIITYNNNQDGSTSGSMTSTFPLRWANSITIADDGTVTTVYSGTGAEGEDEESGKVIQSKKVKWITDTTLDTDTGKLQIDYNTGKVYNANLTWVKDIKIAEDGVITLVKTTGENNLDQKLSSVTTAMVKDDGTFVLGYNTKNEDDSQVTKNVTDETGVTDFVLKNIKNITFASGNEGAGIVSDKRINVQYNNDKGQSSGYIGDPINSIQNLVVRSKDHHLFVLFTDPTKRATVQEDGTISYPSGTTASDWISNTDLRQNVPTIPDYYNTYGVTVYWRDYGTIKEDAGILIGTNVFKSEVDESSYSNIRDYLNGTYPSGLTEGMMSQKVVTYDDGSTQKEFWAFDYDYAEGSTSENPKYIGWYSIGTISDDKTRDVYLGTTQQQTGALDTLTVGGILFEEEVLNVSDVKMPIYWEKDYSPNSNQVDGE